MFAVVLFVCFLVHSVSVGKPTFMMILNQMMNILWQTAAVVANGEEEKEDKKRMNIQVKAY